VPVPGNPTTKKEAASSAANPFTGLPLYVEPGSPAETTANEWTAAGRLPEAGLIDQIADQPVAKWFGGWSYGHGGTKGDVAWWVGQARAAGALPVLVAYDLPWRDCSQYSSGGAADAAAYRKYIDEMTAGIGGHVAVVLLEPDALSELSCLSAEQQASYYSLLDYAVKSLSHSQATAVYLDAGHAGWQSPQTIAARLKLADVAGARGFALNISNFDTSASEDTYGRAIDSALGLDAHFVIDTSRNGRGPAAAGAWCNPPGRGLGTPPTHETGEALLDAFLWIKHPGTSDGTCNGGPAAGTWWPAQALELATNAVADQPAALVASSSA
jgi:endoglucanase